MALSILKRLTSYVLSKITKNLKKWTKLGIYMFNPNKKFKMLEIIGGTREFNPPTKFAY